MGNKNEKRAKNEVFRWRRNCQQTSKFPIYTRAKQHDKRVVHYCDDAAGRGVFGDKKRIETCACIFVSCYL